LLGLPVYVDDAMLRDFLEGMGASIDSTTVIMDRKTGESRRYGFAKFSSVEHARAFVEPNFPTIPWKSRRGPSEEDGLKIKINYAQKTGHWREGEGANARVIDDRRGPGA
jgi:RNA recognition motif-containing protein